MAVEPADGELAVIRLSPPMLPPPMVNVPPATHRDPPADPQNPVLKPSDFRGSWRKVDGLGRNGTVLASSSVGPVKGSASIVLPRGRWRMLVDLLPTYADRDGEPLRLSLRANGREFPLSAARQTGDKAWSQGVLDNRLTLPVDAVFPEGRLSVDAETSSGGILLEAIRFVPAG
jgi:hypothetical protein